MDNSQDKKKQTAEHGDITWRAMVIGIIFAMIFAFLTIYLENMHGKYMSASQIPVMPYIFLVAAVAMLNPLIKLVRIIRPLTAAEILTVFAMGLVSSGISTFGLASQVVPVMSGLMNKDWNKKQTQWDIYIEPYVKDRFFVAEKGVQKAALKHVRLREELRLARERLNAAEDVTKRREARREAEVALAQRQAEEQADSTPTTRAQLAKAKRARRMADERLEKAQERWEKVQQAKDGTMLDIDAVLADFPARIETLAAEKQAAQAELDKLEAESFEVISRFRKGLPEDKRAIPGFLPLPSEGLAAWELRFKRLRYGRRALTHVRQAEGILAAAVDDAQQFDETAFGEHIDKAVEELEAVASAPALTAQRQAVRDEREAVLDEFDTTTRELGETNRKKRNALRSQFNELDSQIKALRERKKELQKRLDELKVEDDMLTNQLNIVKHVRKAKDRLAALKTSVDTPEGRQEALEKIRACKGEFSSFDADLSRFLFGEVPWHQWARPVLNWAILILLTYLVLMSLNVLIFRQWAHNEKLDRKSVV